MPTTRHTIAALAVALVAIVASACQAAPPATKAAPVPDRVAIASDSIGLQAMYYGSAGTDAERWDFDGKIGLGWRAMHAQPRVTADVANPAASPDTLVVEFGHNYRDGYTTTARNEVTALAYSPADTACVVLVKPYAPPSLPASHQVAISLYRAHVDTLTATRPHTVSVDWATVAMAHPDYLDSDGIHLNTPDTTPAQDMEAAADGQANTTDPAAAQAFIALLDQGVASCD